MNYLTDSDIWATLTGGQQGVLWVLLTRAGTDGTCWPLVPHLAQKSGQKERSVQAAIKRFKQLGLITEHQPDQHHAQRYFEFMDWSAWTPESTPEATMKVAHTGAHQAHTHAPTPIAAHTGAPQAHVRAPQAHTGALLIYRNMNRRDEDESSSSSSRLPATRTAPLVSQAVPPKEPATPPDMLSLLDNEEPKLFDDEAVARMLADAPGDRKFPIDKARQLVATYGNRRVREAIANTNFKDAKGEIHTNYTAMLDGFLKREIPLDRRIRTQADADKRRAYNQQAKATKQARMAPARRLSDDAHQVAAKSAKLLITQPDATEPQQREHAWKLLQVENWTRERWQEAVDEINQTRKVTS